MRQMLAKGEGKWPEETKDRDMKKGKRSAPIINRMFIITQTQKNNELLM